MSRTVYYFNGKDITLNVMIQIVCVARELEDKLNLDFKEAFDLFYASDTFKVLQNTENAFWAESPQYIADQFLEELEAQGLKFGTKTVYQERIDENGWLTIPMEFLDKLELKIGDNVEFTHVGEGIILRKK